MSHRAVDQYRHGSEEDTRGDELTAGVALLGAAPSTSAIAAVLFDRDGTLIEDVPYNGDVRKVVAKTGAAATVTALRARGLKTGVVTNQSGVARGLVSREEVDRVNLRIDELLGAFDVWCVCPHGPSDRCGCRKPAPGLVIDAAHRLGVRTRQIVVVGDRRADLGAAKSAGALGVLIPSEHTEEGAAAAADRIIETIDDVTALVDELLGRPA